MVASEYLSKIKWRGAERNLCLTANQGGETRARERFKIQKNLNEKEWTFYFYKSYYIFCTTYRLYLLLYIYIKHLTTIWWSRCHYTHFKDEKTEASVVKFLIQSHTRLACSKMSVSLNIPLRFCSFSKKEDESNRCQRKKYSETKM